MTNILAYLDSPAFAGVLLIVVPLFVRALRAVRLDVTALPRWLQPVPPLLLAGLPVLVVQMESGAAVGQAAMAALLEGFGSIGLYHAAKRTRPIPPMPEAQPIVPSRLNIRDTALVVLIVPLLAAPSSCGSPPQPQPPWPPPATGGAFSTGGAGQSTGGGAQPTEAELLCTHLRAIGCPEGDLGDCEAMVELYTRDDRFSIDTDCLFLASSQEQARRCRSIACGGVQ